MMSTVANKPTFPELEINDQLILREQNVLTDVDIFLSYYNDPLVNQYIMAVPPRTKTAAESELNYCKNLFYKKEGIFWTLANKADNRMLGTVGCYINERHHRAEICYELAREHWSKGIMTQTLRRLIRFLFEERNMYRLEAQLREGNKTSQHLLGRLGFRHEGLLRNYRYLYGKPINADMYALTRGGQGSTKR